MSTVEIPSVTEMLNSMLNGFSKISITCEPDTNGNYTDEDFVKNGGIGTVYTVVVKDDENRITVRSGCLPEAIDIAAARWAVVTE